MFIIEGDKIISDLVSSGELTPDNMIMLCATSSWIESKKGLQSTFSELLKVLDHKEIKKLSSLVTPQEVLAVLRIQEKSYNNKILKENITLVLDAVRDPGNLGTIIRTADWFGIKNIICSKDCVDKHNSKVVQSSMGAILRVNVHYMDLARLFGEASILKVPIYGTTMDGENFYDIRVKVPGLVVFGNESTGIRRDFLQFFTNRIRIPEYPNGNTGTESLNVATSVAIICAELRRRLN